ncbi:uncharacterized protein [Phyllobates terribilis]|uniref:uncharacterized protein n=1 Tax=Phyllobates terribilis TaxID=111132 RepID=UPI003CCAB3AB
MMAQVYILHAVPWLMAQGGKLRMGAHIAERSLLLVCLVALVIPAHSLKCHTCVDSENGCSPTEVTCPGDNDKCSTTALYIDSFPCKVQKVFKGCINSTTSSQKISISPNERITLSLQQKLCDADLCNSKEIPGPNKTKNDLYCHSCISPGTTCNSDTVTTMRCMGEQKLCVDMKVIGSFGDIADVNIKGCGEIPSCTQNFAFSSQTSSVSVQCCNGNVCNSGTDSDSEDKTPNGVQCYSCNTLDGSSCSTESVVKAQCYGALTSCLEIEGTYVKDGQTLPTVIKGCATPSMCDTPILPLLQKLGTPTVKCCNGSLCNNQFSERGLQASGYFPEGNASPGTGIQNQPSTDAASGGNPVEMGHHVTTKYSTSSHSNNGYTEPYFNSYEEFSNSGSVYDPNIPIQGDQSNTYNELSVGNLNLFFGCNIFPNGDETTENDSTFIDSEGNTVSNPINYPPGHTYDSILSPGPSTLVGEGAPNANHSNSDGSSIPDAHPTFPDFSNYGEDSFFPNSNYDNDMNFPYNNEYNSYDNGGFTEISYTDMNFPNSNDFGSYESAGFTDVVYTDLDWNEDPSSSPTVTPDSVGPNSYDIVGSSSYNPNAILSANNNETGGHSTNTVNSGSNVNVQGNNGNVQNLTSTTPKTHNSDLNLQISGYGANTYNTDASNNNASGNNISSPIHYSSGENNLSVLPPGSSTLGGEGAPNSSYSNSDGSSIPDTHPTFPDFSNYGEDSFFPNSNYDNDMNFPANNEFNSYDNGGFTEISYTEIDFPNSNDFNSYESAGFTDVVYTDLDWNVGPSNSPTVAPDSVGPNSHDIVGSSAYNPIDIVVTNNNETGGHSTNTVNNGSNVNVTGTNNYMHNLNPTTPKPHISDSNQHISENGTNIHNIGTANNNGSENNFSSPSHYSSGENNLSVSSSGPSTLGGDVLSNYNNNSTSDGSSIPDALPTFPDFSNYGEDSFFPNSNYDNEMNFPYNNEYNNYDNGGFTEISYTEIDFPNSNDFSNYENAGFTDVVYTDLDWNVGPSNSPTVAPDSVGPNSHDIVGSSAYNPNDIVVTNNNETGGHSTNTVNSGSNVNVQGNNGNVQNLTSTTPKTHNSDLNLQISGYGANTYNMDASNNNGSGNNISSPIHYSSGENNLSVLPTGSSTLGGESAPNSSYSNSDGSSIPDAHPTFPDFSTYGEDSFFPNSNYDNDMNFPDNNEYNSYDNGGFTEISYTDIDFPNSNDFNSYESAGFTDVVYTDLDWNVGPSNSPTVAPDSVGPNSHDIVGSSAYNPNDIVVTNNNETGGHSTNTVNNGSNVNVPGTNNYIQNLNPTTPKPHIYDSNQHISENGTNIHNIGNANNNGAENNFSSPIHYSSGENNLSVSSSEPSTLGGDVLSNYNNNSTSDGSSIPDAQPTFPDFSNYGEDSFFPNSNYDNDVNFPNNNEYNSYDNGGFTEISYTDIDFPNSNDLSNYENAGFTDVVCTDLDINEDPSNSPTVGPDSVGPNSHDIVGSSAYNPNDIVVTNNNETGGHSTNTVNNGGNVNVQGNNCSVHNLNLTTPKPHNSDSNQQISTYGTNINNIATASNNGSENNVSSPIHYSSGENNLSVLSSRPSTLGDVLSNYNNNSTSHGSSIPGTLPTFPAFSNYGEDSFFPNSNSDNDVNFPDSNEYNSHDNGGFTEISYTDVDFPNSNDFSGSENAGFTDVVYTHLGWNEDQSNSPTEAPDSVGPNSQDIVGNSGSDTSSAYNPDSILLTSNNDTGGHSADTVKTKTHNSGIKQHISGHAANIHNTGIANNNGSGNYISSSGNNTAGSGNSSIASNSGSSSLGGYINSGNGTGMTNEWNNSNNYSNHNNAMPVGNTNIPGNNNSSPSNSSFSNETRLSSDWLDTVMYSGHENNDSSWGNSSNSNMTEHVGYTNIHGNNGSTTSYTSSGNGTGISNDFSTSNSSKPNMSVPGGYTNVSGSNDSSTSYGSSDNGTGMNNSNNSNHSMVVPEGHANITEGNGSSTSYSSPGNGNGIINNSSYHNVDVSAGHFNVTGGNGSSTFYASPGGGTEFSNGNSSSNHSMLVPEANDNVTGSNGSSTSYTSSSNGTGITNEWITINGSYHNMTSPGGDYGSFNSNGSSHLSDTNYSSNFLIPNNGPTRGNGSNYDGPWDTIKSYLNYTSSGANNNGSFPNISSWTHDLLPGGSSYSNETDWSFGSNYNPNMMTNNKNNDTSSYYNNIQHFLSKLNGSIHSNGSNKINEWIQNNSFLSNLMPPGVNNGYIYNASSISLSDYFKSLGISSNNTNIPNIPSIFPSGNISNFGSGWSNIMYNPNLKNPHANGSGPIPSNIGSYGNIQIPNFISPDSPNNNGSSNTNSFLWGSGSNGQPNNPNAKIPGGYSNGSYNVNGHNSNLMPSGENNPGAGNNMGHESINNSSHNSNMMVPGVGSGGSSYGGTNTDGNGNVYNTNSSGHNTDVLVPGRSTNDSSSDGASNGSGGKNGTMLNSATSLWTKSGHFVIFSALALVVLN